VNSPEALENLLKMRIAIIAFAFIEYTIELANELAQTQRVLLVLPERKTQDLKELIDPRVETAIAAFPRARNPLNLFYVFQMIRRMYQFKPQVIHFQGSYFWFNLALPFLGNCPVVTTIHDPVAPFGNWQSRKLIFLNPNSLAMICSNRLIVHGQEIKRALLRQKFLTSHKIHVIPHGQCTSFTRWKADEIPEDTNLILFFGRIWQYKGLEYLIKAEPEISRLFPAIKIIIAGSGEPIDRYLAMIEHPDNFLIFNYFVPEKMVAWLFQKAALVVLPYLECSQSGVIPLAYSFAKPVIATQVGSIPDVVEHEKTGILVAPGNSNGLAQAVIGLLRDRKKRRRLGQNGYRKVCSESGWQRFATMTIQVYREALSEASPKQEILDESV
jgi:glycosyltransferase involved in cell wall biosynthesis